VASDLAIKARTLVEVKDKLEAEVAANSKRIGFQRAIDLVTEMHLDLLKEVFERENDEAVPRKVSAGASA
jgi:hypothetical protein